MTEKIILSFKLILLGDANTGKTAILNQYIYHTFTNTKATTGIDFFTKIFEIQDFIVKLNIYDTAGQQRYLAMTKSYFRGTNAVLFTYSLTQKQSFLNLPKWIKNFEDQAGNQALKIVVGTKQDLLTSKSQKHSENDSFPQNNIKKQNIIAVQKVRKDRNNQKEELQFKTELGQLRKKSDQNENGFQQHKQLHMERSINEQEMKQFLKTNKISFAFETSAVLNKNIDQVFEQICKFLILKQMNKSSKNDNKNRQRVQSQFTHSRRRESSQLQSDKLSLQQHENNQSREQRHRRTCC